MLLASVTILVSDQSQFPNFSSVTGTNPVTPQAHAPPFHIHLTWNFDMAGTLVVRWYLCSSSPLSWPQFLVSYVFLICDFKYKLIADEMKLRPPGKGRTNCLISFSISKCRYNNFYFPLYVKFLQFFWYGIFTFQYLWWDYIRGYCRMKFWRKTPNTVELEVETKNILQ